MGTHAKKYIIKIGQKPLPGFTLMEVLIGMALTAIVVLLGMSVIVHFSKLIKDIQTHSDKQQSVMHLYQLLRQDMEKANVVSWDNELVCGDASNSIRYIFLADVVVRSQLERNDTLVVRLQSAPEIDLHPTNPSLVCKIKLQCVNNETVIPLVIFKQYPSGILYDSKHNHFN